MAVVGNEAVYSVRVLRKSPLRCERNVTQSRLNDPCHCKIYTCTLVYNTSVALSGDWRSGSTWSRQLGPQLSQHI